MKLLICRFALSILLASSFAIGAAGQVVATASPQNVPAPPNTATRGIIDGVRLKAIPGASFSARAKFESMQTLADGSTLAHHTFNIIARDSRGRTHNEFRQWNDPVTGAEGKLTYAILYDPDTRTRTYLYPAGHVARQYVFAASDNSPAVPAASNPSEPTIQKEDLGVRRDGDLQLTGTRETKTYPAGSIGNEQSLTLTTEYWFSPDLQINISVKRTDPRSGVQTVELTDLRRDEPDPSLFELPADYRIVNETGPSAGAAASATSDITTGGGGAPERIRMGGNVQNVKLLNRVQPVYPLLARQTGIQGTVRLHAILGKDGTVQSLTLESGHPLLVKSALEAVSQWRYQPTLLNGNPVEVDTTIDVVFVLAAKPATPELSAPVP
jgi:TonB family protein